MSSMYERKRARIETRIELLNIKLENENLGEDEVEGLNNELARQHNNLMALEHDDYEHEE